MRIEQHHPLSSSRQMIGHTRTKRSRANHNRICIGDHDVLSFVYYSRVLLCKQPDGETATDGKQF
jgi:hypothetical protein